MLVTLEVSARSVSIFVEAVFTDVIIKREIYARMKVTGSNGFRNIHLQCKHSGIVVLLLRMLQRSSVSYQFEEVLATVDLINRMLTCNKVTMQLL